MNHPGAGAAEPESTGRRSRVTQACDSCSRRRAKCDGSAICGRCQSKNLECVYSRQMRKRGPSKGSAVSVRERISRLEKLLEATDGKAIDEATRKEVAEKLRELGSGSGSGSPGVVHGMDFGDGEEDADARSTFSFEDGSNGVYSAPAHLSHMLNPAPAYGGVGLAASTLNPAPAYGGTPSTSGTFPAANLGVGLAAASPGYFPFLSSVSNGGVATPSNFPGFSASENGTVPKMASNGSFHSNAATPNSASSNTLYSSTNSGVLPMFMSLRVYRSLVGTFLSAVWPTLPILHPPTLLSNPGAYPAMLIHLVLAVGIRFSKDPEVIDNLAGTLWKSREVYADSLFEQAHKDATTAFMEIDRGITAWDVMTILHLELYAGAIGGRVGVALRWMELAILLSREIALDNNDDLSTDEGIRAEERRRMFWALFMMDRGMTFGSSIRPFSIPRERAMPVKLPFPDDVFTGDKPYLTGATQSASLSLFVNDLSPFPLFMTSLGQFAKLVLLFQIFTQIIEYHKLPSHYQTPDRVLAIQQQLDAFYECLPITEKAEYLLGQRLEHQQPTRILPLHILLIFYSMLVLLHSPIKMGDLFDDDTWLASESFLKTAEAAGMVSSCLSALSPQNVEMIPFWSMFPIMRTTQIHIVLVRRLAGTPSEELRRDMRAKVQLHINVFHAIGARARFAPVIAQFLQLLLDKHERIGSGAQDSAAHGLEAFSNQMLRVFGYDSWDDAMKLLEQRFGKEGYLVDMAKHVQAVISN